MRKLWRARLLRMHALIKKETYFARELTRSNGTYVTQQLRDNDLRLSVGISSKRKEQLINCWETRKSCVMAAIEFLSNYLANISSDFCLHVGS